MKIPRISKVLTFYFSKLSYMAFLAKSGKVCLAWASAKLAEFSLFLSEAI